MISIALTLCICLSLPTRHPNPISHSQALVSSNHIALERDGSAASTMIDPSRTAVTRETSTTLVNASSSSTAVSGVTGTLSFESVRNRFHSIMEREQLSKDSVEYSVRSTSCLV